MVDWIKKVLGRKKKMLISSTYSSEHRKNEQFFAFIHLLIFLGKVDIKNSWKRRIAGIYKYRCI